ncbi:MAG: Gfo/Idh/MocA family oxidoreductase [Oscillospiraceae bacterium]|nr:Gfo/Idh/MocA family oxidoreductase [Oscillospiraceae bacterium]
MKKMKTAVIGSGRISEEYLKNMMTFFNNIEVVACSSEGMESARARATQFGIEARTNEEIFADPEIEMVVVLVPAPAHYELIERALNAGKHVYTEKTMTVELDDAKRLVTLADEKGLYLGSAPDTFLGAAYQTARKALDDGLIGEPISFSMNVNRNIDLMASMFEFLRLPGGGFAGDYGVYYLTALVALLGPVESLFSVVKNKAVERINCAEFSPDFGKPYTYDNESQIYAVMNLENGITGTVSMDGDSAVQDLAYFYIYGSKGVLKLTCANDFGGDIVFVPSGFGPDAEPERVLPNESPLTNHNRGVGPAEMADAIAHGRACRASKEMAFHVLDVIDSMMRSSKENLPVNVESTCARPDAFTPEDIRELTC